MTGITQPELTKLLQVELPESWLRHLDVEAAKRGLKRKGLVLRALRSFLGEPPDYEADIADEQAS
jgi:hypothetical protein